MMEIHRATRKDRPAGFADVIAFPGNSDVKKDLQDLLDQIGSSAKITPAARRSYSIKPDRTPVRRPSSIEKQPSQVKRVVMIGMFLVAVLLGTAAGWALSGGYLGAEQRALDARANELTAHAFGSGSPLACLIGYAGDVVESSCENALFSTPEATAGAVSYVAAQLSILADDYSNAGNRSYGPALTRLRRALEIDRFGLAAHILSLRDGCSPDQCRAFALLGDSSRIRANLREHTYESVVARHSARWQTEQSVEAASSSGETVANPPSGAGNPKRTSSTKLNFPSSASIPAVNIMDAEPSPAPSRKR